MGFVEKIFGKEKVGEVLIRFSKDKKVGVDFNGVLELDSISIALIAQLYYAKIIYNSAGLPSVVADEIFKKTTSITDKATAQFPRVNKVDIFQKKSIVGKYTRAEHPITDVDKEYRIEIFRKNDYYTLKTYFDRGEEIKFVPLALWGFIDEAINRIDQDAYKYLILALKGMVKFYLSNSNKFYGGIGNGVWQTLDGLKRAPVAGRNFAVSELEKL